MVDPVEAGNVSWSSPTGGVWSEGANWSGGSAPGPADTAVIDLVGTYTITMDMDVELSGLSLGAASGIQTLAIAGQTLTAVADFDVLANGRVTVANGEITGAGTLGLEGTVEMDGSAVLSIAVSHSGFLRAKGASNEITGSFGPQPGSITRVDPTTGNLHSLLSVATGFTNHGRIELSNSGATNREAKLSVSSGTLLNAADGTIESVRGPYNAGTRSLDAVLENDGLLSVKQPLTIDRVDADHNNAGSITVTEIGNLNLVQSGTSPSLTHTGTMQIDSGRVFTIQGGTFHHDPGTTSGTGTLRCEGVELVGVTHVEGGPDLLLAGDCTVDVLTNSSTVIGRSLDNVISTVSTTPTSILRVDPSTENVHSLLTIGTGFTNHGRIELSNSGATNREAKLSVASGTLVNAADGTIESVRGPYNAGTRTLDAVLDNDGLLSVKQPLTIDRVDADHTNAGSITVTEIGNLTLVQGGTSPSLTHTGTMQIDSGRVFTIQGGTFHHDPGTTSGTGTLRCEGVELVGVTHVEGGPDLLLAGDCTVDVLTNSSTVIGRSLDNVISTVSTTPTSILRVDPSTENVHSLLTIGTGFTNHGRIELSNSGATNREAKLSVSSGTLLNAADGTIESVRGPYNAGTRSLDAVLDNDGLLSVKQPLTIDRVDADHTNAGSITVTEIGNLTLVQGGTSPSLTHTGTMQIDSGRVLTIEGGRFFHDPGTTSGDGTLRCEGVRLIGVSQEATAADLLLAGNNSVDALIAAATVIARGPANVVTFCSTAPTTVLRVDPSTENIASEFVVEYGFTNHGRIELTNGGATNRESRFAVGVGTLVNAGDGTIESARGPYNAGTRTLDAELDNQGLLSAKQPLLIDRDSAGHLNSGDIVVSEIGAITLVQSGNDPSLTHVGTIQIDAGRVFTVEGGELRHDPGTTSGEGTLRCEGVALIGVTHREGAVELLLAGDNTCDVLENSGTVVGRGLANEIASFSTAPGSVLRVDPSTENIHSEIRIETGFTNHGVIELTNGGATNREARLVVSSGTLINAGDGRIEVVRGPYNAGTRTLDAALENRGALLAEHGLVLLSGPVANLSSGSIEGAGPVDVSGVAFTDDGAMVPQPLSGSLSLLGDDPRGATSALNVEIGGVQSSQYDRLAVSGVASLGGALNIDFVNGFEPALGDSFAILTAASCLDTFDLATGILAPNGVELRISYKSDRVDLIAGEAGVNAPPVAMNDLADTGEELGIDIDVLVNDFDANGDSIAVVPGTISDPAHGLAFLNEDQTIRYQPAVNFAGVDSFTYVVSDLRGGDDVGTVVVSVAPRNDSPRFLATSPPNLVVYANEIVEFSAVAKDVDVGDQLELTSTTLPAGATMSPPLPLFGNPVSSEFFWIPTEDQEGFHEFEFYATDDSLAVATLAVRVEVRLTVSSTPVEETVAGFDLGPAYPNPSLGPVRMEYALPEPARVRLTVYDVRGRELESLVDATVQAGRHTAEWDGRVGGQRSAAGVYLLRLESPGKAVSRRVVITR